ncbi:MAG: ATP-binding protein, partial [Thermodesulfovibrionales bacterium]|nr:ATP-binding protein [Thermodesulfovibrionales bacterium]
RDRSYSPNLTVKRDIYRQYDDGRNERIGTLIIAANEHIVIDYLKDTYTKLILTRVIQLGFIGLVLFLITKKTVVDHLENFSSQVQRLLKDRFAGHITLSNKEVLEIKTLEDGFNKLIDELNESYKTISKQNEELENKVIERTKELQRAMTEANAASQAKSDFLANISHEIRTPMNAILGISRLMLNTPLSEKQKDYQQKILLSAQHLLAIINDILDFSKIEANKIILEEIEFNLEHLISEILSTFSLKAQEKSLNLIAFFPPFIPKQLIGDPLRLNQALSNLINNAIKFTKSGEISIRVALVEEFEDKVRLLFSVSDTGIGMDEGQIKSLFEPFTQADVSTTRKYGGTGLGLSITKRIVELMNGSIAVMTNPEKGSEFNFTALFKKSTNMNLPYKNEDNIEDYKLVVVDNNQISKEIITAPSLKGAILLVEDNPINQQVATEMLKEAGLDVTIASNGREAIEKILTGTFDLALMDIQMPEIDGYKATKEIRKIEKFKDFPIIAMTAHAMTGDRDKCINAGMNDYVSKPIDPRELYQILAKWLKNSHEIDTKVEATTLNKSQDTTIALPETLVGFDIKTGLRRLGGNKKLYLQLLIEFRTQYADCLDKILSAIETGNLKEAEKLVHMIKGIAGNLSANELFESAKMLNKTLHEGFVEDDLLDNFKKSFTSVIENLNKL